jgi:hypothetical protein
MCRRSVLGAELVCVMRTLDRPAFRPVHFGRFRAEILAGAPATLRPSGAPASPSQPDRRTLRCSFPNLGGREPTANLRRFAARPTVQQKAIQAKRDERKDLFPLAFINSCSFTNALSISLSTHQLVNEFFEQQSRTLSQRRIPRSTCS